MAWSFQTAGTVAINSRFTDSENRISVAGVNPADSITPDVAHEQINKLLGVVGWSIRLDSSMKRTQVEGAVENE